MDEDEKITIMGVPWNVPQKEEAYPSQQKTEDGTVMMSPILRNQLPEIEGEAILQAQSMHVLAFVDLTSPDGDYTVGGPLVGISSTKENEIEITVKILVDDGMKILSDHASSKDFKLSTVELSKPDEEEPFLFLGPVDTKQSVEFSCRIDEFDFMKNMCALSLKFNRW